MSERDLRAIKIAAGSEYRLENAQLRQKFPSWEEAVKKDNVVKFVIYKDKQGCKRVRL